jgi:uncharacterized caspase-like protein
MLARRSFLQALAALAANAAGWARGEARAPDGSRVALVMGNNAYAQVPLVNAANDARAMSEVLTEAGFAVDLQVDDGAAAMSQAVRAFGKRLEDPRVKLAFFYYAGHGAQVEWRNYLLPVDANVASASELRTRTFELGALLELLPRAAGKVFVIVLDACRDNPFGPAFHPERKGLSAFDAPPGSLIAFSTAPGGLASDGLGKNGLYTENLARELRVSGLRLEDVFKRVRVNVSLASRGMQVPWESTSLLDDVYVLPPRAAPSEEELERQFEAEVAQWNRVKGSRDPQDWAALLRSFPNGKLCEIAQAKLNGLLAQSGPGAARGLPQRGPLRLGEGRPVPDFLARPANPFSAGWQPPDRRFTVGDEATYSGTDEDGEERTFRRHVTRVSVEDDRVELNGGRFVTDLQGNLLKRGNEEFEVPVQVSPAEFQVGKRWGMRFRDRRRSGEFDNSMSAQVVARERIRVPAGEFDAFRIEMRTSGVMHLTLGKRRDLAARRDELVVWEVPGLNFPVKQERTIHRRSGRTETDGFELVSLRQAQ